MKQLTVFFTILPFLFLSLARAEEGFYYSKDFQRIPHWNRGMDRALLGVGSEGDSYSSCTYFYTSNKSAYAHTAMQCVVQCMAENGEVRFVQSKGHKIAVRVTDNPKSNCLSGRVVWTSKYFLYGGYPSSEQLSGLPEIHLSEDQWDESTKDFAILDMSQSAENNLNIKKACIKVADASAIRENDQIFAIGYPTKVERTNRRNAIGGEKAVTVGKFATRLANFPIPYPDLLDSSATEKKSPAYESYLDFLEKSYLFSNVDINYGMSGGPALNVKGDVLGILSIGLSLPLKNGNNATLATGAVPLSDVRKSVEERFGSDFTKKLYSCER